MNSKTIILVVIFSMLVGFGIFFGEKLLKNDSLVGGSSSGGNLAQKEPGQILTPPPTPKPTLPPIDSNSNLKEEIKKLELPDFSQDYVEIKKGL